jgi:hypothetical protein
MVRVASHRDQRIDARRSARLDVLPTAETRVGKQRVPRTCIL